MGQDKPSSGLQEFLEALLEALDVPDDDTGRLRDNVSWVKGVLRTEASSPSHRLEDLGHWKGYLRERVAAEDAARAGQVGS